MADIGDDSALAINGYLITRVRKLEEENAALHEEVAKLRAFLESWRDSMVNQANEAGEYFALLDGHEG